MCSRYAFVPEAHAWADYRAVLGGVAEALLAEPPRPRLAPTDAVPIVVRRDGGEPEVVHARWGFVPHWWSRPELPRLSFNARSEEAAAKPMWRDALRRSRCLVPGTCWMEWQHAHGVKVPHSLRLPDGRGFMFAGLWSTWRKKVTVPFSEKGDSPLFLTTCVILTMDASPAVARVHDRMPVVLAPEAWADWLDPGLTDGAAALELARRHAVGAVTAFTVDRH
jgi:putative SOS response-associated peptidase YedK